MDVISRQQMSEFGPLLEHGSAKRSPSRLTFASRLREARANRLLHLGT